MSDFELPKWAGQAPSGLHLDVYKNDQLIRKIMLDDKQSYYFGRNRDACQVVVEHSSCSRVHCVLLYHKHLNRSFLIDLGSTHGTFLGKIRLDDKKPTPVQIGSTFRLGASTRSFVIREKPKQAAAVSADGETEEAAEGSFLGISENVDYDEITEFNTAHNRRIPTVIDMAAARPKRKRSLSLRFAEEDTIINPEDIDPSVGRFRNLVQQTVIIGPNKKVKTEGQTSAGRLPSPTGGAVRRSSSASDPGADGGKDSASLYSDIPGAITGGLRSLPNSAPAVSMQPVNAVKEKPAPAPPVFAAVSEPESKRKKYAKEAWPGRAPTERPAVSNNFLMS
ncbi:nuclear inhibitor of protein phosphatase 1-like [Sycon ciliatum]|uniref:nuclear inhibitor of protein phosphatase 1-like n=1 Tax=Sycon ciliatum TaxID=27933 RepID=UPI0020A8B689|eukprot:scpid74885/ scgid33436/ Nuclear inhibitor of protein phosphatase 1; Protein phosphatase 1 regulatory inhibitor subunit 8